MCYATHNKPFGWFLTAVNEVHKRVVLVLDDIYIFLLKIVILYNVGGVDILYPVKFPHTVNLQELLDNLVLGLPCPAKFTLLPNIQDASPHICSKSIIVTYITNMVYIISST